MSLAQEANRYLDGKAPWKTLKDDREATATTLWVTLSVINCLKVLLCPFLPFSSRTLHELMGFQGDVERWDWQGTTEYLPPGQMLAQPKPMYTKLDDSVVEEETLRLGAKAM
jgi:methionyl-tRNA synthetase